LRDEFVQKSVRALALSIGQTRRSDKFPLTRLFLQWQDASQNFRCGSVSARLSGRPPFAARLCTAEHFPARWLLARRVARAPRSAPGEIRESPGCSPDRECRWVWPG